MYLLFWSIILPICALFALSYFKMNTSKNSLLGIVTLSIFFYCCTTNAFTIYNQRKRGVFDLLQITPFSIYRYLVSISVSNSIITTTISALLLLLEVIVFNLSYNIYQMLLLIFVFFLTSVLFTLIGFILSAFPKNENQLSITSNVVMIPLFLFSGLFFDLSKSPILFKWISYINPVEAINRCYTSIISSNQPALVLNFFIVSIFVGLFLVIAKKSFEQKK